MRVPFSTGQDHWDLTTLALKKGLARFLAPGMAVLEVGTGEAAVLSIFAARKRDVTVVALDVSAAALVSAKAVADANGTRLHLACSDLLQALRPGARLDLIFFNPPYVPTGVGQDRRLGRSEAPRVWDGGPDGADLIRRFLAESVEFAGEQTRILLGFGSRYVSEEVVRKELLALGFRLETVVSQWWNPSRVYVLRRAGAS